MSGAKQIGPDSLTDKLLQAQASTLDTWLQGFVCEREDRLNSWETM